MKWFLLLILASGSLWPQRRARARAPKATPVVQADTAAPQAVEDSEMAATRAVQVRARATYADLCRLILLQGGQFSKYKTDQERCQRVSDLGILKIGSTDIYKTPVTLGATTKAAINAHGLGGSLMFRLTGFSWYALQSAEALGLIAEGMNAGDLVSGAELMQIFDEAQNLADEKSNWMKTENPYREFGYETYEEMYYNPAGAAKINTPSVKPEAR